MSIEIKAFLISIPVAVLLAVLLVFVGIGLFGESWDMKGFPLISLVSGLVSYFTVKQYLERRSQKPQE